MSRTSTRACVRTTAGWSTTCRRAPDRLIGLGMVSLGDIDAAIDELRLSRTGGCAVCASRPTPPVSTTGCRSSIPSGRSPERLGLPVHLHVLTGSSEEGDLNGDRDFVASYVMFPRHIQQTIADLITEGVLERFPGLKVVSAEIDIGWIGTYLSPHGPRVRGARALEWCVLAADDAAERLLPSSGVRDVHGRPVGHPVARHSSAWRTSCGATTTRTPTRAGRTRVRRSNATSRASPTTRSAEIVRDNVLALDSSPDGETGGASAIGEAIGFVGLGTMGKPMAENLVAPRGST